MTVTDTTAPGYLTVYPAGRSRPITSDVDYVVRQSRAHSSVTRLGVGDRVEFYNGSTAPLFNGTTWSAPDPNPGTSLTPAFIACPSADLCVQGESLTSLRVDGTWTRAFRLSPLNVGDGVDGYASPSPQFRLAYAGDSVYVGTARPA